MRVAVIPAAETSSGRFKLGASGGPGLAHPASRIRVAAAPAVICVPIQPASGRFLRTICIQSKGYSISRAWRGFCTNPKSFEIRTSFDSNETSIDWINMATSTITPETSLQPEKARTHLHAVADTRDIQVDGEAAESVIAEKRIGERIKHLRLRKSMGLVELGRHTGLSASFLSQLETGRVVPTLRNLARIAMVFSKDLNYFFEPEPLTLFRVHRGKDRLRLPQTGVDDPSYFFESLGYLVPDRQLDPYFAEFVPAGSSTKPSAQQLARAHQHFGCEFLYVLSGSLTIRHGVDSHLVHQGDAVYFDASTTHSYECAGTVPATALIVTLQQPVTLPGNNGRNRDSATLRSARSVASAALPAQTAKPRPISRAV
jgi:transcriptional regulator with XRE-family HTH domain